MRTPIRWLARSSAMLARNDAALRAAAPAPPHSVRDDVVPAPPPGVVVLEYLNTYQGVLAFAITRGADGEPQITAKSITVDPRVGAVHRHRPRSVTGAVERPLHGLDLFAARAALFELPVRLVEHSFARVKQRGFER